MSVRSNRRGIALVSALALLAFLGLLLVGAVASATIAQHALHASLSDAPLLGAADYAAGEVLADPQRFALADLALQRSRTFGISIPSPVAVTASVTATRLPSGLYWLVARSASTDADTAVRRIGILARTVWIGRTPAAPFVARGPTTLSADVVVLPDTAGEPDCAAGAATAPLQTADSASVFDGAGQWLSLAAGQGVRATAGDTTIGAGVFDGILMVAGNLVIDGPFDMTGLIIARGTIRSSLGVHLTGALVSQSAAAPSIDLHGATVRYAPCIVDRLLRRASPLRAVRAWGWAELF